MLPPDDEELRRWLDDICKPPVTWSKRNKALNQLLSHLQRTNHLLRSNHPEYASALNHTFCWVNQSICGFDSAKSNHKNNSLYQALVNWVNGYLGFRIKDLYKSKDGNISLDQASTDETGNEFQNTLEAKLALPTLSGLEAAIAKEQTEERQAIASKIRHWILTDPDDLLKTCSPKASQGCNCQILAQRILLDESPNMTQISKQLDVNYQSLISHWKRKCLPILQAQTHKFGYQPE